MYLSTVLPTDVRHTDEGFVVGLCLALRSGSLLNASSSPGLEGTRENLAVG